MGVAVHRQPHPERLGDAAEQRGAPQPAPEVVVGQHDLHGVGGDRRAPRARTRSRTCWSRAARRCGRRRTPSRRCRASGPRGTRRRRPAARRPRRRSPASRRRWGPAAAAGRGTPRAAPRSRRTPRRGGSTPPLSLSEPKPQPSTIRFAWATIPSGSSASPQSSSGRPGVAGPLVEEVAAERHPVADGAAEQVADRAADLAADQVEAGDLERRVDGVDRGRHVEHPAEGGAGAAGLAAEHVDDEAAQPVQVVRVVAGQRGGDRLEPREVGLVGVRLAQARAGRSRCAARRSRAAPTAGGRRRR